ncbi:MAG: nucleoside phosphorylase [Candidatus Heimdallarchaeota archaeon]|nr:MAG: nucleoside phosphorylase [Candidatus Heimdallarchaeota archaeon]
MTLSKQPHIKLKKVDKFCLISGNPDRVPIIASYLQESHLSADHRGLVAYKGKTPKKYIPVTVLTTGMGCPSTAIVLEEAFRAGGRFFIRVGSTAALIGGNDMGIGSLFIPHSAIRDEGTSSQLAPLEVPAVATPRIYQALCTAASNLGVSYNTGIVWSTDIYYSDETNHYTKYTPNGAVCVEMESSTLFIFGSNKKIETGVILTSDGNLEDRVNIYTGDVEKNKKIFELGVQKSIECTIAAIEALEP